MTRPEAMKIARAMQGAWSAPEIARYLAEQGVKVSDRTAWRWANDAIGTSDDNSLRVARRRNARVFARITALRDRGVSYTAIAAVLSIDFECEVSAEQVRWSVKSAQVNPELHKVLFGQEVPRSALLSRGRS